MALGMHTNEILKRVRSDIAAKKFFLGVFARDRVPRVQSYPCSAIINTDASNKPGEHWVAFYIDELGKCSFFDSFGRPPRAFGLQTYLNSFCEKMEYNSTVLQPILSSACGHFCICFVLLMSRGWKLNEILEIFCRKDLVLNNFIVLCV
jgi:hypothetical protein